LPNTKLQARGNTYGYSSYFSQLVLAQHVLFKAKNLILVTQTPCLLKLFLIFFSVSNYLLTHLYTKAGLHIYRMVLFWDAGDEILSEELFGDSTVYDINETPPIVIKVRKNDDLKSLAPPCK